LVGGEVRDGQSVHLDEKGGVLTFEVSAPNISKESSAHV
jgi:hypothetical protein